MSKSSSKTSVFRGRKDAMVEDTYADRVRKNTAHWNHVQSTVKTVENAKKKTKTMRKSLAATKRSFKDVGLQNKLIKQHIGAGLIFGLVARCMNPVWQP